MTEDYVCDHWTNGLPFVVINGCLSCPACAEVAASTPTAGRGVAP